MLEYLQGETVATVLKGTRGFTAADFATKAYAPTTKNARYGHFTGIQVQNAGASPINITITYVGTAGSLHRKYLPGQRDRRSGLEDIR